MTQPDQLPDNFDINSLSEPTPETLSQFGDTCLQLDNLGVLDYPGDDPDTGEILDFYTIQLVHQPFSNGTEISSFSFHGNDELATEWSMMSSIRSISLKTAGGDYYKYSVGNDGNAKLFVKKPGARVRREIDTVAPLAADYDNSLSVSFNGTPDFMRAMRTALAERREADRLGLNKPTEASIREFNKTIQDALASGVVIDKAT